MQGLKMSALCEDARVIQALELSFIHINQVQRPERTGTPQT